MANPQQSAESPWAKVAAFLGNPLVAYGLGGLLILAAVWAIIKALPSIFSGLEKGGAAAFSTVEKGFNTTVDRVTNAWGDIAGRTDNVDATRTRVDRVQGLAIPGERDLSDLVDSPLDYLGGLIRGAQVR